MFFPWVGMLEQLKAADTYVHYDDVQFSKGSFTNRVQVKTAAGVKWLTVPLEDVRLGMLIKDVRVDSKRDWRRSHLDLLRQAYKGATEMLEVVERVYAVQTPWLCEVAMVSMMTLADVFGVRPKRELVSSQLGIGGHGTGRVLEVVKSLGGTRYVSGAGGKAYLDHAAFAAQGISVEYMEYAKRPYAQAHGEFTPFVSALDVLASVGPTEGKRLFVSTTIPWKEAA
ncbi:MAG: WbqC family protein [Myxococcaceae bacterium]|nr:WbqC family protein [Myxococcaceae bacterium]